MRSTPTPTRATRTDGSPPAACRIPSRVFTGASPIVTQGRTTPAQLVQMGLLDNLDLPRPEVER
ncbi:Hypothetical protein CAP_0132 [Chondromyces apiculatus DSM 436]|uniref:Uncharacterized protein n=1 Tax=Chondromyces apiculatus DSM 436 TaxID=1192034 RepID=A0A017TDQ3_9BACT|nr:Hypothetical protein CAP_0132 [Chondromyces apiculatus DSM 436]